MKFRKYIIKTLCILSITIYVFGITGCNKSNNNNGKINNSILSIEDEKFIDSLSTLIREGKNDGSAYLINGLIISPEDTYSSIEIVEKYISDNAIYIKIEAGADKYLYRFQIDEEGLITSYIKYNVEA